MSHPILIGLVAIVLAGCSTVPVPPSKLVPPSARLMAPPEPLADVQAADSLYQATAVCRAEYGRETGKLKGLQTYIKTVIRK